MILSYRVWDVGNPKNILLSPLISEPGFATGSDPGKKRFQARGPGLHPKFVEIRDF